ncbi:alanine racemase [Saccharomonospora sp. NPDC046836]|uniref:alanine racemase n=1 Tax=Saccharomonospora sp. NPDC046836 TaxID=3156921 RepID=UPI0033E9CBA7
MTSLKIPAIDIASNHKGFPPTAIGSPAKDLAGRLRLLQEELPTPVLLLKKSVFENNLEAMRQFCNQNDLFLSPHAKTAMSPEIASAQLDYGAWGLTVATSTQAITLRNLGANRILLANELMDSHGVNWLSAEMDKHPSFYCYCYVDSPENIEMMTEVLRASKAQRKFPVIIEVGVGRGRAGTRTIDEAALLARQVEQSNELELVGVGGFEGVINGEPGKQLVADVRGYLVHLRDAADRIWGLYPKKDGRFIVTVGGSVFIELIADTFDMQWRSGRPIDVVMRSGCYVTHDSSAYQRFREYLATQYRTVPLAASLELWSRVLSRPEPDLAILDFGKRDTGSDAGFPVPVHRVRRGTKDLSQPPGGQVVALNDQHAYFRSDPSSPLDLEVGDKVAFGISHPCTTLDKWRLFPMVDDSYSVVGTLQTMF